MKRIKFRSLSSGSNGNCYFLGIFSEEGACETGIIIDTGVSPRRFKKEMAREGIGFGDIDAILITHDHHDHVGSLGSYCKHIGLPVYSTRKLMGRLLATQRYGTYLGPWANMLDEGWNEIVPGRIKVQYFEVPHDATQTVGYAIMLDDYKFVIMTDVGRMVPQGIAFASAADTVVVESNYDPEMLFNGPYPPELQARISDGHGHMSNKECAEAVRAFDHEGLQNVFLCHLSEHNNTPELAMAATRPVLDASVRVCPLPRMTPSPMFDISKRQ